MLVGGVVDKVPDHAQQLPVGFQLDDGAVAELLLGNSRLDLQLGIHNLVGTLVGFDIGLAAGQPLVDECQTLVDELGGIDGLLVLLVLAALVIQFNELVEDVLAARLVVLGDVQVDAVGLLGGQLNLDALIQAFAHNLVTRQAGGDVAGLALLVFIGGFDGKRAVGGLQRRGQGDSLDVGQFVLAAGGLDVGLACLVQVNLELDARQGVKHLLGGDDLDGRGVIVVFLGFVPSLVLKVAVVDAQLLDDLGAQLLGREDDHLVVDLTALAHELHALEQAGTGAGTVILLGNEHDCLDVIDALGELEIDKCQ